MQVELKSRFPTIEVAYETDSNNKSLTSQYNICMAIPTGRKQLLWFTHEPGSSKDAAYITDAGGTRFSNIEFEAHKRKISYGTIIAGTIVQISTNSSGGEAAYFIINDIYMFEGIPTKSMTFAERLHYIIKLLESVKGIRLHLCLPYMCAVTGSQDLLYDPLFYDRVVGEAAYQTHHIQFRSTAYTLPYLNHNYNKQVSAVADKRALQPSMSQSEDRCARTDLDTKAALKLGQATFMVMADLQDDIYHLYAADAAGKYTYIDIAFVATRADSVMLNSMFRNIRENANVELGEESEDEDTFQNTSPDKYVDLKKQVFIDCLYSARWKKWIPICVAPEGRNCIQLNQLISANPPNNNMFNQKPHRRPDMRPIPKHNSKHNSKY